MGSKLCNTCETPPTPITITTAPYPTSTTTIATSVQPYNKFTKQIQLHVSQIRKKYGVEGMEEVGEMEEYGVGDGVYKGVMRFGVREGYGEFWGEKVAVFGFYEDGKLNGEGLIVKDNKNYLRTTFINNTPTGQSTQSLMSPNPSFNPTTFHGNLHQSQKTKGILTTPSFRYEGSFKNNKFHGYGILQFQNGDRYQGDFMDGVYHGDGVYETRWGEDGGYRGEWRVGRFEGKGEFCWGKDGRDGGDGGRDGNGGVYVGGYLGGVRNGSGRLVAGDQVYEGEWVNGELKNYKIPKPQNPQHQTPPKSTNYTHNTDLTGYVIELF